eukprot:gene982-1919_t
MRNIPRQRRDERAALQWSFLQLKRIQKTSFPAPCFLQSGTQIGSKILIYGGCDYNGDALGQLFIFDTIKLDWSVPGDGSVFQEDHPGSRYGHSATLIDMHPPKIMIFGGMVGRTNTFEFESPDSVECSGDNPMSRMQRPFMNWRRKGKNTTGEEVDDSVYLLEMSAEKWRWTKPITQGGRTQRPPPRAEHSACKTATNEVMIFGGWTDRPTNDLWSFNTVNLEWSQIFTADSVPPRPRYRHTSEVIGNTLYILGGSDNGEDLADGARHLGLHAFDLQTMQWIHHLDQLRGIDPFPRSGHSSAVIGARSIVIFGGKRSDEVYMNDLVIVDVSTLSTTSVRVVESCLPTPVANCSLSVVGNTCFVFGGTDTKGTCYNDVRSLDIGSYLDSSDITVSEGARSDYSFKILVIGDASVGKSSLLVRFAENVFLQNYTSTIGIDFNSRMIRVDGAICKLEIWDTAGQERFSTITANYYRGAQGALLVYDVGLRDSFNHVRTWYERAKQLGGSDLETVLVGNKSDLSRNKGQGQGSCRQVGQEEGEALATELGIHFIETSALDGSNVEKAFVAMTAEIKRSVDRRGLTGVRDTNLKIAGNVVLADAESRPLMKDRCSRCS